MNQSPHLGFIVGMGRSGTTLIAALLNRHSEICVLPETGFFIHIDDLPNGIQSLADNWPVSMQTLATKMQRNATPAWDPMETAQQIIARHPKFPGVHRLFHDFCIAIASSFGKREAKLILEKTPDHMLHTEEIKQTFPDAPILHIIRDGRAVAESRSRMDFLPPEMRDLEFNMLNWAWRMNNIRPLISRHHRVMEFHYENLVQSPDVTLKKILDFLHLRYDPNILYPQGNEDQMIETNMTHKDKVKKPVDPELANAWQKKIPEDAQKRLEYLGGKQLTELGYSLHHLEAQKMRTALIPEDIAIRPGLLKKLKRDLIHLLAQNNTICAGTYQHLDTTQHDQDIYIIDPVDITRIRNIGAISYFTKIMKLMLNMKLKKKRIYLLKNETQYRFRNWPMGWALEALVQRLAHV